MAEYLNRRCYQTRLAGWAVVVVVVEVLAALVAGLVVGSWLVGSSVGFAPMDMNVSDCCLVVALDQSPSQ